jgi:hypothetical protein
VSFSSATVAGSGEAGCAEPTRGLLARLDLLFATAGEEQAFATELARRLQEAGGTRPGR